MADVRATNRSAETAGVLRHGSFAGSASGRADDECALVQRAQHGDRDAFNRLVYRHDRHVLQLALSTFGNPERARQIYLRTFREVYGSIGRFPFDSSVCSWISGIARQVCADELNNERIRQV